MRRILLIILVLGFVTTLSGCRKNVETDNVEEYGAFFEITGDTALAFDIFPESVDDFTVNEYYFQYVAPIYPVNPDIEVFLDITLSEEDFASELERISNISYTLDGYGTNNMVYNEDLFNYPAYIVSFSKFKCFEYVLIDEGTSSLIYVSLQYQTSKKIYFDENYLPLNYDDVYDNSENSFSIRYFN